LEFLVVARFAVLKVAHPALPAGVRYDPEAAAEGLPHLANAAVRKFGAEAYLKT
jgi:hypothetical protein